MSGQGASLGDRTWFPVQFLLSDIFAMHLSPPSIYDNLNILVKQIVTRRTGHDDAEGCWGGQPLTSSAIISTTSELRRSLGSHSRDDSYVNAIREVRDPLTLGCHKTPSLLSPVTLRGRTLIGRETIGKGRGFSNLP